MRWWCCRIICIACGCCHRGYGLFHTLGVNQGAFLTWVERGERLLASRIKRGERGLWQRRFWERLIRDEADLARHIDYLHWNPVKHGWVSSRVIDWPHSNFHRYVRQGAYPRDWGGGALLNIEGGE